MSAEKVTFGRFLDTFLGRGLRIVKQSNGQRDRDELQRNFRTKTRSVSVGYNRLAHVGFRQVSGHLLVSR